MAMNIDPETRERSHALNAYYEPNKARENLIVVTGALVTNLHFSYSKDEKGNAVATSISYTQSHGSYSHNLIATATASKEIILAAGALQTPKLLELSGVGSEGLLRELDIPIVVSNENIGENLQDHTNCGFSFEVAEGIKTMDDLARQKLEAIEAAMGEYATEKKESFATGGKFAGGILPVVEFLGEDGKVEEFKGKYRDDDDRPYRTRSQAAQNTY